jgi:hypothetical protein
LGADEANTHESTDDERWHVHCVGSLGDEGEIDGSTGKILMDGIAVDCVAMGDFTIVL